MNIACPDFINICTQNFGHRAARYVSSFLGKTAVSKIPACMLGIAQINVRDVIHDPAVGLLGEIFVKTSVAGFHVEDRNL